MSSESLRAHPERPLRDTREHPAPAAATRLMGGSQYDCFRVEAAAASANRPAGG